jgi:hypothetical protein
MRNTTLIFILVFSLPFTACVSVSLSPGGGTKRASGVDLKEPGQPFTKQSIDDVDAAWKNESNGNAISYVSDCRDTTDPSLDSIMTGLLSGIREVKRETDETVTVQGREGKRVLASGKVDGVPTQLDLLVFKRNQCIYILSYVGVKTAFMSDRPAFNKFIEGFRAP